MVAIGCVSSREFVASHLYGRFAPNREQARSYRLFLLSWTAFCSRSIQDAYGVKVLVYAVGHQWIDLS
ncbi:hypothetical protein PS3A_21620 [Pseudomonas sp. 3A(2025)]